MHYHQHWATLCCAILALCLHYGCIGHISCDLQVCEGYLPSSDTTLSSVSGCDRYLPSSDTIIQSVSRYSGSGGNIPRNQETESVPKYKWQVFRPGENYKDPRDQTLEAFKGTPMKVIVALQPAFISFLASIPKVPQYLKKNKIKLKNDSDYKMCQCTNNAKAYDISLELKMENPSDAIKMAKMEDLLAVQAAHKKAIKNLRRMKMSSMFTTITSHFSLIPPILTNKS
ncbi:putative signal peptide protein [Puccinia sorghi]|uniref:Putative signal peptide protein n=1 Tax=Puccinia sorghi TaxID=27349 RepID=A0A0L6VA63_9BASI|nr:putative signal peptide protein [Puccinia sorghi]